MKPRSGVSGRPLGQADADPREAELTMIALLCLLFVWPPAESTTERMRPSPR